MILKIKLWLLITCLTFRTPNWIRNTFTRICEMDLDHALDTPWGSITGRCNTVIFRGLSGGDFVMAETTPGELYVKCSESPNSWNEVYRHNKHILKFGWVYSLKRIHAHLKRVRAYEEQEMNSIMASNRGIM